jgi:glycosyltransferase involved in cell wall biosynthesis
MPDLDNANDRRARVLLSAYACEPLKGSEPGVGWNWVREISRFAEVWVLTRENNRRSIEAALSAEPMAHAHFVYYDLPRSLTFWKKGGRGVHVYYYLWQAGAYFVAKELHRKIAFDLIHHATFASCWFPSFLAFLPVPFVWGPVGGGESTPGSFWKSFSNRGKLYELLRVLNHWRAQCDPFVRATARRTGFGLATTSETEATLRALGCSQTAILSLAAIGNDEVQALRKIPERLDTPFRVLSVGRLLHWKGFHLGMEGFAHFHRAHPTSEYWIIGDGAEKHRLRRLASELAIEANVCFWGELPRADALQKLGECDVLIHPSLHDSSGWVSIEAMAAGRPVICLNTGGLALQVDEQNGVKIPATSPQQAVAGITAAFENLSNDLELRLRYGRASRARVDCEFNWARKAQEIRSIYVRLLRNNALAARSPRIDLRGLESKMEMPTYRSDTFRSGSL